MGEQVYVVLNGAGEAEDLADNAHDATAMAKRAARRDGGEAVLDFIAEGEGEAEAPRENAMTAARAYDLTGLPAVLRAKYGIDRLSADVVMDVDLDEAHDAVRPFLPKTRNWDRTASAVDSMLSANAKLRKGFGGKKGGFSVSMGLSLAPHEIGFRNMRDVGPEPQNRGARRRLLPIAGDDPDLLRELVDNKHTLCAGSTPACRAACLVFSGQNEVALEPYVAKMGLTAALLAEPVAFARLLVEACTKHFRRVNARLDEVLAAGAPPPGAFARLNVFQDLPWEEFFPDLVLGDLAFPDGERGQFYDYTKVEGRHYPDTNYDLTFSYSGSNARATQAALERGQRVAVVFVAEIAGGGFAKSGGLKLRKQYGDRDYYPWKWEFGDRTWPVWNADRTDLRPGDPAGAVAGLTYKVPKIRTRGGKLRTGVDLAEMVKSKFVVLTQHEGNALVAAATPGQEHALDYDSEELEEAA